MTTVNEIHFLIRQSLLLSHDLGIKNKDSFYGINGKIIIDYKKLCKIVLDSLISSNSKITYIEIVTTDSLEETVKGTLYIEENIAYIYVNSKQNECWQNFTICKELLQLYIDHTDNNNTNEYNPTDIITQLELLIKTLDENINKKNGYFDLESLIPYEVSTEFKAIIATTDLIFPYKIKEGKALNNLFEGILLNEIEYLDIARFFKMPEYMIKIYAHNLHDKSQIIIKTYNN